MPRLRNRKAEFTYSFEVKFIAVFSLFLLIIVVGGCDFYYKNMPFASIPAQTISGSVTIGSDWTEIIPPAPLRPIVHDPWIILGYFGYSKGSFTDDKGEVLNLADGRKTKIEAFLFDDKGGIYELQISGTGGGIMLTRKIKVEIVNGKQRNIVLDFPNDRVYTKLKIRSEIPLECDKIEWINAHA